MASCNYSRRIVKERQLQLGSRLHRRRQLDAIERGFALWFRRRGFLVRLIRHRGGQESGGVGLFHELKSSTHQLAECRGVFLTVVVGVLPSRIAAAAEGSHEGEGPEIVAVAFLAGRDGDAERPFPNPFAGLRVP